MGEPICAGLQDPAMLESCFYAIFLKNESLMVCWGVQILKGCIMRARKKLDVKLDVSELLELGEGETGEQLSLDELIVLYKSTIEKLKDCALDIPSGDAKKDFENFKKEESLLALQDKIMETIVNRPISKLDDIRKILSFWQLTALGYKDEQDYKTTDHLILKSLAFMEVSKI